MRLVFLIGVILTSLTTAGCAPIIQVSGYVPLKAEIELLKIGFSTRVDVLKILGEPLNYSEDSSDSMLYVQQKVETIAFLKPRVSERTIVKLTFDESNTLSKIEKFTGAEANSFELEKQIVISQGRKLTFWQQMFGNISNFSSEQFLD